MSWLRGRKRSAANLVFEEGCVHDTEIFVRELANITAEEDGLAGFDQLHRNAISFTPFDCETRRTLTTTAFMHSISVLTSDYKLLASGMAEERE